MAKITKDTEKWGSLTPEGNNLSFIGEELVPLEIEDVEGGPNHYILCINGNQIILGVGEKLKVPQSVYDMYKDSVRDTNKAKRKMAQTIEIKA